MINKYGLMVKTGICGKPQKNKTDFGHFTQKQGETDRVLVELSHRTTGRWPIQRRKSLPDQAGQFEIQFVLHEYAVCDIYMLGFITSANYSAFWNSLVCSVQCVRQRFK